jgi:anti-sigma B factor antagonist
MALDHFRARTERNGDDTVMRLEGELDMSGTFVLEPKLDEITADVVDGDVLFDLTGVTFIDSTGLGALVGAHERLRDAGVPTRFVRGSDEIQRVFEVAGFDGVLDFVDPPAERQGAGAGSGSSGTAARSSFVCGCCGWSRTCGVAPASTTRPSCSTTHCSHSRSTTARLCVMSR